MRRSSLLHTASAADTTADTILATDAVKADEVLDAIRPVDDPENRSRYRGDEEVEGDWFDDFAVVWSLRHRIWLNGRPVYAAPTQGRPVVVPADDYQRPYDSWEDLLTFSWDSSSYAGVGLAGYGVDGLYRVRPGVVAVVSATDESLEVTLRRVSPRASTATLVSRLLDGNLGGDLDSDLRGDRIWRRVLLAAAGYPAEDLLPDDAVSCRLTSTEIRRLLAARGWLPR